MRIAKRFAKPARPSCGKTKARFGTCISVLSFIIFVALIGAVICYVLNLFHKPSPPPITVLVMDPTKGDSESSLSRVLLTNASRRHYNYVFWTEVFANGRWHSAFVQHSDSASATDMPPRSGRLLSVPIPQDGDAWRVKLVGNRVLDSVETKICRLFRCLKLEYPFAKDFQVEGPEMLNPSIESTRPCLITKHSQKTEDRQERFTL